MNDEINTIDALRTELAKLKKTFTRWFGELKAAKKRTYPYSEGRAKWQAVQNRMTSKIRYTAEAEKEFHRLFAWEEQEARKLRLRCVTTK